MSYQFAEINGVRMHYDIQGQGDALLLIHAGIANLDMWDDQMPAFTKHFRVIRHDVRGFGETPDPAGKYTDHDDVLALLAHLKIERAHILGNSNGGRIAIDFAIAYPKSVGKLVLVDPGLGGFRSNVKDAYMEELEPKIGEAKQRGDFDTVAELTARAWVDGPDRAPADVDPDFRQRAVTLIRRTVAIPWGEGEGDIERPPAAGRLNEIKAPTLLIMGKEDVVHMMPVADTLEAGIPNIKRVDMEGAAHLPSMEKPKEFNKLVLDFLLER